MLKPIKKKFRGLITISGPIKSGKSQFAEYLVREHESITYIATSRPRNDDPEWEEKINVHRRRRPKNWKLIEYPVDICNAIYSVDEHEPILIDSLGGLVEQHLKKNLDQWNLFHEKFINSLINNNHAIIIVSEEIGWGIVPATQIGHLFRERLCDLSSSLSRNSDKKWLVVHGQAIDLDSIGYPIP